MKFDGIMPLVVAPHASSASTLVYEYEVDFYRAFMTFSHQTIFDPEQRCMKPLLPFDTPAHDALYPTYMRLTPEVETSEAFPFLGHIMQDSVVAAGIADGLVDPSTLEAFNLPEHVENVSQLNRRHSHSGSSGNGSSSGSSSSSGGGGSSSSSFQQKRGAQSSKQATCELHYYCHCHCIGFSQSYRLL
jgi:uncharacterized membrane protein YgcG